MAGPDGIAPLQLLVEASVLDNGIFVSWQRQHIRIQEVTMEHQFDASKAYGVTINPRKDKSITLGENDRLVIIAED